MASMGWAGMGWDGMGANHAPKAGELGRIGREEGASTVTCNATLILRSMLHCWMAASTYL